MSEQNGYFLIGWLVETYNFMAWQGSITTKSFLSILFICLSAAFLILIFPKFEIHFLAWIALVPLFLLIKHSRPSMACLAALITGLFFYGSLLWWTLKVNGANPFNWSLLVLGNACYFGVFASFVQRLKNSAAKWNFLTFPAVWVVLEYLHVHIAFLSFPWGILGYSQYAVMPVARISAFAGVYGVSFLIVMVNTVIAELIYPLFSVSSGKVIPNGSEQIARKMSVGILVAVIILFSASYLSGRSFLNEERNAANIKAGLIQGNIYWEDGKDYRYRETIFETYRKLSLAAANLKPNLIAWPSASVPGIIPKDLMMTELLYSLARKCESFLLVGSGSYDKFNKKMRNEQRISNSAFLFSPQGKIAGKYDKILLLPFDEYLPLRSYLKWPSWIVDSNTTDYLPGNKLTVFKMNQAKFGVLICWENLFPDLFRKMTAQGVDFMVSMTNEAFTNTPSAHYQMLAMNVFRAIENRVSILRIAPTGVSAIIWPSGRITTMVQDNNSKNVNIKGYAVGQIPLLSKRTFYNRYGDWFVYCLFVMIAGFVIVPMFKKAYFLRPANP